MPDRDSVARGVAIAVSRVPSKPKRPVAPVVVPPRVVNTRAATPPQGARAEVVRKGAPQTRNITCAVRLLPRIHRNFVKSPSDFCCLRCRIYCLLCFTLVFFKRQSVRLNATAATTTKAVCASDAARRWGWNYTTTSQARRASTCCWREVTR